MNWLSTKHRTHKRIHMLKVLTVIDCLIENCPYYKNESYEDLKLK